MNFYTDLDKYGKNVAVITDKGEQLTYDAFLFDCDNLVSSLTSRRLLFLVCNNSLDSLVAYVGALRKSIVPVMINSSIDGDLYRHLYEQYKPAYVYAPKGWSPIATDLASNSFNKLNSYRDFDMYETCCDAEYELHSDLALLLTTSGSTGSPKLVRQSYDNINANASSIANYLGIVPGDRAITTMPMSYTYCLSIINSHLLMGASLVMNDYSIIQREFWTLFKESKPTTFGGVPYIYDQLKKLRFGRMNLPSLRYITQAGGKLSKEMAEEFNEICESKGIQLIIMYGQTEATARMAYLPWEYAKEKAGSMGIAIPGGEFSLIDVDENVIHEPDVVGELVYRGPNVTLGYAESYKDLALGDERHGVLVTGDMAKRDKDGFYYIVGRKKRFLKMYGNRVNLDEVEGLLKKEGYECVCAGVDDHLKIYTTVVDEDIHKNILGFLSKTLGFVQKSFQVIVIDEIPRNESGKVLYSALN
ncbi:MAG: AMP-binding protein [Lachnospiraceae bacterium]|nr:AMP-binding protein [Lachnospiraceae bacterium]